MIYHTFSRGRYAATLDDVLNEFFKENPDAEFVDFRILKEPNGIGRDQYPGQILLIYKI